MLSQKNMGIYKIACSDGYIFNSSCREGSASEHATMPEFVNTKSKKI